LSFLELSEGSRCFNFFVEQAIDCCCCRSVAQMCKAAARFNEQCYRLCGVVSRLRFVEECRAFMCAQVLVSMPMVVIATVVAVVMFVAMMRVMFMMSMGVMVTVFVVMFMAFCMLCIMAMDMVMAVVMPAAAIVFVFFFFVIVFLHTVVILPEPSE
jgi:hypothetical protein